MPKKTPRRPVRRPASPTRKAASRPKKKASSPKPKATRPSAPKSLAPGELGSALLKAAKRVDKYPEIDVRAVVAGDRGGILALAREGGDFWALPMPELNEAIALPLKDVYCGWSSANGATYLGTWNEQPIVRHHQGKFEYVALDLPRGQEVDRVTHLKGRTGTTPDDDTMFCIAEPYVVNELPTCSFCWRKDGRWRTAKLPLGHPGALAAGADGEAYVSVGRTWPPDPRAGRLFRWSNGALETLPFPPEEELVATSVVGMHATADGRLLAFFGWGDELVRPWVRDRDGTWSRVEAPQRFCGWDGHIGCHESNGIVRVLTEQGIFVWDGERSLRRETAFNPVSIWAVGDLLFASAWQRGAEKVKFLEGKTWKPLHVPEPDVVFGGHGKVVWLGAKNKVPVRRLRMKAPAPAPSEDRPKAGPISLATFLERLEALADAREPRVDARTTLERNVGVPMAPDLRAFFDLHTTRRLDCFVGHFRIWTESYMRLPDTSSTAELVSSVFTEVPSIIAALTNTVHLGADAGGQIYFGQVDPRRSEVFLYGPGVGELKLLADSFESFAELNEIEEQLEGYCKREGLDADDLGDHEGAAPEVRALAGALRARAGHLNLTSFDGSDVASDFDATMTRLAGKRLAAKARSLVPRMFERADWLVGLLAGIHLHVEDAAKRNPENDLRDPALAPLAATKIYWLWHLFLFDRREELAALLERARSDDAGLVRATAKLMDELMEERALSRGLERFRRLRASVADALAGRAPAALPDDDDERERLEDERLRALVAPTPADSARIQEQKKRVRNDLRTGEKWDDLTFAYFEERRYDAMLEATEARLAVDAYDHYPWLQKGIALALLGRPLEEALAAFDQSLYHGREEPRARAWIQKCLVYAAIGDRMNALLHLREAIRLNPAHREGAKKAAVLASYLNDPDFLAVLT